MVDFKTHPVGSAEEADRVAEGYLVQVSVYQHAAELRGPVKVRLEFTSLAAGGGR